MTDLDFVAAAVHDRRVDLLLAVMTSAEEKLTVLRQGSKDATGRRTIDGMREAVEGMHAWLSVAAPSLAFGHAYMAYVAALSDAPGGVAGCMLSKIVAEGGLDLTGAWLKIDADRPPAPPYGHTKAVRCVALSPDKRVVATGSDDTTARLWTAGTGQVLATLNGHEGPVTCIAFSSDGSLVATGSDDRTAHLWHADGTHVRVFRGHVSPVTSLAFSANGLVVATVSSDEKYKSVRYWLASSGDLLLTAPWSRDAAAAFHQSPEAQTSSVHAALSEGSDKGIKRAKVNPAPEPSGDAACLFSTLDCTMVARDRWVSVDLPRSAEEEGVSGDASPPSADNGGVMHSRLYLPSPPIHASAVLDGGGEGQGSPVPRLFVVFQDGTVMRYRALGAGEPIGGGGGPCPEFALPALEGAVGSLTPPSSPKRLSRKSSSQLSLDALMTRTPTPSSP